MVMMIISEYSFTYQRMNISLKNNSYQSKTNNNTMLTYN